MGRRIVKAEFLAVNPQHADVAAERIERLLMWTPAGINIHNRLPNQTVGGNEVTGI
jgi:hypothetical protein